MVKPPVLAGDTSLFEGHIPIITILDAHIMLNHDFPSFTLLKSLFLMVKSRFFHGPGMIWDGEFM
jgi:hypothetical protein